MNVANRAADVFLEYVKSLRFDDAHHLGLGDIRLTIGQCEEIASLIRATQDEPESIIIEPCAICGSTGFHRADCVLFSYPCAICGARISNMNALEHVHKPLPLYVGKPDDSVTTLNVSKSDWLARAAQQNDSNRTIEKA